MEKLRSDPSLGVIGCGAWGKNLVRNFAELGVLEAVADENPEVTRDFAVRHEVRALTPQEMLADPSIQAVAIVSWAPHHFAQAREALENGKHVYVEKPLAMMAQEAKILTELAEKKGLTLMAGHILQYHSAFVRLKALVEAGEIGELLHISTTRLGLGRFRYHENAFWDLAPHDLSMILSLMKSPVLDVQAFGHSAYSAQIPASVTALLTFEGSKTAEVKCSWMTPIKEQRLVAVGSSGMLVFEDSRPWAEKLALYRNPIGEEEGRPMAYPGMAPTYIPLGECEPLKEECRHFLEAIQHQTVPLTDGRESMAIISILEQVEECLGFSQPQPQLRRA